MTAILRTLRSKKSILVCSVAAALAVLAIAVSLVAAHVVSRPPGLDVPPEAANKPTRGDLKIDLAGIEHPDPPGALPVYLVRPIGQNRTAIEDLAKSFGVDSELKENATGSSIKGYGAIQQDSSGHQRCFKYEILSGTLRFWIAGKYGCENPNLPSVEESCKIAQRSLAGSALLPEGAFVSATGGEISERTTEGTDGRVTLYRNIEFARTLDGLPVMGPGMRTRVSVGTDGEIIGVMSTMRKLVPYKAFPTKTLEEATRDAQEGNGTMNLHPEVKDPKVTKVELLYYADPAKPENKYLIPVYCFSGPQTCIYVPAVK